MLKSASGWSLAYLVPIALLLAVVEVIAFTLTRRRDRARRRSSARGSGTCATSVSSADAPQAAQALRRVPDIDLRSLQVRGSARVRGYVAGLAAGRGPHPHDLRAQPQPRPAPRRTGCGAPPSIAALVFVVPVPRRVRASLSSAGCPRIGQLPSWPGVGGLLETFTSAWRYSDLGSATPAPAQLGVFSVLGTVLLGATGLARTIIVVGALPFGVFGVVAARAPHHRSGQRRDRRRAGVRHQPAAAQRAAPPVASARSCSTRSRRSSSRACCGSAGTCRTPWRGAGGAP